MLFRSDSASGKLSSGSKAAQIPTRSWLRPTAILAGAVFLTAVGAFWWLKKQNPPGPARTEWVQITNFADSVSQPALSPDGRMLTFIRGPNTFNGPGQIYIKMLPSGDPVQLTHDDFNKMSPVFSPDGSRIAYTAVKSRQWDTWVVPVLGGDPRLWLPNASGLAWIGKSNLLFSEIKDGFLHMATVTAEESRANPRDIYLPAHDRAMSHRSYLSPDRKSVLIVEMNASSGFDPCRLVPFDGASPSKPVGPPGGECHFGAWSPDGKWMYFSSNAGGLFHIWRQSVPDGQPEQITSGPTEEEGIAMAPDGGSFVTAVGVRQSGVWVHDARGERQISLEGWAFQPRFSPDGTKLVYRIRTGTSSELWVADLASNRTEPLLPGFPIQVAGDFAMGWHAGYDIDSDGRRIVFYSPDRGGKPRLWIAPLDRHSPPRQVPGVEGEQPVFGPSGEIFFRKLEANSAFLYSVREDGTALQRVSPLPIIGLMSVHPSHKWLGLGSAPGGQVIFPVTGGAPIVTHTLPPPLFRWTGDGKYLFVVGAEHQTWSNTYVVPLSHGEILPESMVRGENFPSEAQVAKMPGVRTLSPATDIVPGPTADVYAFTRVTLQRNLYRIPLR